MGSWVGFEIALRPVSQFELGIEPGYNFNRNFAQWIENKDEDGDGEDDHFIFGELESRVFEIGVRGTWAFTPSLSLQLFAQPFATTGDYGAIKELARPRSYEFSPYAGLEENPDFPPPLTALQRSAALGVPARQHALRGLAAEPGPRLRRRAQPPVPSRRRLEPRLRRRWRQYLPDQAQPLVRAVGAVARPSPT